VMLGERLAFISLNFGRQIEPFDGINGRDD
jgi:hypothetical protein